jgi:hypothetical protein
MTPILNWLNGHLALQCTLIILIRLDLRLQALARHILSRDIECILLRFTQPQAQPRLHARTHRLHNACAQQLSRSASHGRNWVNKHD